MISDTRTANEVHIERLTAWKGLSADGASWNPPRLARDTAVNTAIRTG